MLEFVIRTFQEKDREDVLKLHYDTFVNIDVREEWYQENFKDLEEALISSRVIVAELGNKIVGLAAYISASEDPELKADIQNALNYSWDLDDEVLNHLRNYWEQAQKELGKGEVVIEHFSNEFTQEGIEIKDSDLIFTGLAVHLDFRRRSIGTELAKKRIEIAREKGSSAIYVECWEGGNVSELYAKLGFLPILKGGPKYYDGNAQKVMGFFLK